MREYADDGDYNLCLISFFAILENLSAGMPLAILSAWANDSLRFAASGLLASASAVASSFFTVNTALASRPSSSDTRCDRTAAWKEFVDCAGNILLG